MEILLMTGTIKPYCDILYSDVQKRYNEYIQNIENYIKNSIFDIIIFAENSGFSFPSNIYENMAIAHGKIFEYLDVSQGAEKGNISIGDAKIIADAIQNSKFIGREMSIWKVSGRVYIENINNIILKAKGKNIFLYSRRYNSLQTWLFKSEVNILEDFFLEESVLQQMKTSCIEYVWKRCWEKNSTKISLSRFPIYPNAKGINSSGGLYSMPKWKLYLKNILLILGWYSVKK